MTDCIASNCKREISEHVALSLIQKKKKRAGIAKWLHFLF